MQFQWNRKPQDITEILQTTKQYVEASEIKFHDLKIAGRKFQLSQYLIQQKNQCCMYSET